MNLKGTGLVLTTIIIQVLVILYIFTILPMAGLLMCIDLALIIATYYGFKARKQGWAIFAIVYGVVIIALAIAQGSLFNISGILLLIAGILGVNDKE